MAFLVSALPQAISIKNISIYPFYILKTMSKQTIKTTIMNNQSKQYINMCRYIPICYETRLQVIAAFPTTLIYSNH